MELINLIAIILSLSALFAYINTRFIGLPTTIGVMVVALCVSLGVVVLDKLNLLNIYPYARQILASIDFNKTLMQGMLSFLLFAGALHVNLKDLANSKWAIGTLATAGVILSTFIVGTAIYFLLAILNINISYIYCLLFGALISPTDPIAVLSILKRAGVAKTLETKIAGESLFNDGVGVVVFVVILGIAQQPEQTTLINILSIFAQEALGGIVFGLIIGALAIYLLKTVDNYQVEILLTLALVMGGYTLALSLHTSGPIAVVVMGLLLGNHGRQHAMSETTRQRLDSFWELIDELLNVVLFVLIGLELLILNFSGDYLLAGLLAIPLVLLARLISVGIPISALRHFANRKFDQHVIKILTWGGIKGGISVALALTLPAGSQRDVLLLITYTIVVFSIIVQGLTIGKVAKKYR